MAAPRLKIRFEDRVGFVFDVSRVIFAWGLNIVSIEIETGCLYLHIEKIADEMLKTLIYELKQVRGVIDIEAVPMMPAEERENKIRAVLDSISEGVIAVDTAGNITTLNPVAENIFRLSSTEMLGKNISEVVSPEAPILACLKDGKAYNYKEVMLNTPQGRVNFITTGRPLKDENGNIIGAVACIKDMSDVKQLVYSVTRPTMTTFKEILGESLALQKVLDFARMVARGDSTVLIRGESGTGKELFARAMHMESRRQGKPFVPINCAALPENLLESELFGYVEGAFTGAKKGGKIGLIEFANNGTLFLDEVGELSPHLQAKLLRVLQDGKVRRIGEREEHEVDVRFIAATNRNLEEMIKTGQFREDLYYRLNVVPIYIPPLRQRKEDIPLLAKNFINKFNLRLQKNVIGISADAMQVLLNYHWPGNVRELENVLERAVVLTRGNELKKEDIILDRNLGLTDELSINESISLNRVQKREMELDSKGTLEEAMEAYEKELLLKYLTKYDSIRKTAKALGISHTALLNKIKKYGLENARMGWK